MEPAPNASCSATGMSRAACLLGHDFLWPGELLFVAVVVQDADVVPVGLARGGAVVAPLVNRPRSISSRWNRRFVQQQEWSSIEIRAENLIAVHELFVRN